MAESDKEKHARITEERRARLRPIVQSLIDHGDSVFLDLFEMALMIADLTDGSITFDSPRVVLKVLLPRSAARRAQNRGVEGWPPPRETFRVSTPEKKP